MEAYLKIIKMIIQTILYCLFITMIVDCSKEKQMVIGNTWQVESIKVHADSSLQFANQGKTYTLKIEDNKRFVFKFDVNSCSGKLHFGINNKIDFSDGLRTQICCDSDFAEDIFIIFSKITHYEITGEYLVLINDNGGVLNFKKI